MRPRRHANAAFNRSNRPLPCLDVNDPTKSQGQWKEMQLVVPLKDWHFYRGDRVSLGGAGRVCGELLTVIA